jgi:rhodanese-related sulfurtransferase
MSGDLEFDNGYTPGDDVPVVARSLNERIRADLAQRRRRVVKITHPDLVQWEVAYRLPTDRGDLEPYFQRAERAAKRKQPYSFDAAVLAALCEGLWFMGEPVEGEDGNPVTFRDPAFLDLVEAGTPSDAVRSVYGSDGVVSQVAKQLLREAGFDDDAEVQAEDIGDPTRLA